MEIKYGGTLEKGDMIAFASSTYITIGWYIGRGPSGTFQYYGLSYLHYWYDQYEELTDIQRENFKKPLVSYVNNPSVSRFVRVTKETLTDQRDLIDYEKAIKVLEILKIK